MRKVAEKRGKEEGCIFRDNGEMDRRGKGREKKENNRYYYFSRNMSVQSINRNPSTCLHATRWANDPRLSSANGHQPAGSLSVSWEQQPPRYSSGAVCQRSNLTLNKYSSLNLTVRKASLVKNLVFESRALNVYHLRCKSKKGLKKILGSFKGK